MPTWLCRGVWNAGVRVGVAGLVVALTLSPAGAGDEAAPTDAEIQRSVEVLRRPSSDEGWALADAIAVMEAAGARAVGPLVALVRDEGDTDAVQRAACVLADVADGSDAATAALVERLRRSDEAALQLACVLSRMGDRGREALLGFLEAPRAEVRRIAVGTLLDRPLRGGNVARLLAATRDPDLEVRETARDALLDSGSDVDGLVTDVLVAALEDPDAGQRVRAMWDLLEPGSEGAPRVAALDPGRGGDAVVKRLPVLLAEGDDQERALALQLVAHLPPKVFPPAVLRFAPKLLASLAAGELDAPPADAVGMVHAAGRIDWGDHPPRNELFVAVARAADLDDEVRGAALLEAARSGAPLAAWLDPYLDLQDRLGLTPAEDLELAVVLLTQGAEDDRTLDALHRVIRSEDRASRRAAVALVVALQGDARTRVLWTLCEDEDPVVQVLARRATAGPATDADADEGAVPDAPR